MKLPQTFFERCTPEQIIYLRRKLEVPATQMTGALPNLVGTATWAVLEDGVDLTITTLNELASHLPPETIESHLRGTIGH